MNIIKRVYIARSRVEGLGLHMVVLMVYADDQRHQDCKDILEQVAGQRIQDKTDCRRVERHLRLVAESLGYQIRFSRIPNFTGSTILQNKKMIERYLHSGY